MLEVKVTAENLELVIARTETELPLAIAESRKSALSSAGHAAMTVLRYFIEMRGEGTWPKIHPLTALLQHSFAHWERRSPSREAPYQKFGKFARYVMDTKGTFLKTGFGTFKQRDVRKGRFLQFDETLTRIAENMVKGRRVAVSDKMRGLMGATKAIGTRKPPGVGYFPLRKTTTELTVPARPLAQALAKLAHSVDQTFADKFKIAFEKREKAAGL